MSFYEFSEFVKQRAEELGLNMTELARRSGVSRQGLYSLLDGTSGQAKLTTLIVLAFALRVHPFVLFRHFLPHIKLPKSSNPSAKYNCDASGFVRDVTIPDNTCVFTDQVFTKEWEIQNIGHVDWVGRKLVCMDQPCDIPTISSQIAKPNKQRLLIPSQRIIDIPDTPAGKSVILSVEFTAPSYPCTLISYWKMTDEHGGICFPETEGLSCMVQVVSF